MDRSHESAASLCPSSPLSSSKPSTSYGSITADARPAHTGSPPVKPKKGWTAHLWDTWNKPPEERKFLNRLDACLLPYAFLSYLSNSPDYCLFPLRYLDQQNVTNAYVSGMKEDLGLHGNQLNYITTAWTCGYVLGQFPSNLLITRVRPSVWIPAMELIWSSLTLILATSTGFKSLIATRFFIGLAEAAFYPAIQYVIGSWYKPDELAKRACLFHTASAIGPMFSGFLQTGAYNSLNGAHGLAGWRWLFIMDGVITIPIALLGFFIMPDLPSNTHPNVIYTQHHVEIGKKRMEEIGRQPPAKFTRNKVLGFFTTWHIWFLTPLYILFNNGAGPMTSMIFWFKSFNTPGHQVYSVGQINMYPLGIQTVQVITTIGYAYWSDALRLRWPPVLFAGTVNIAVSIVLAETPLYENITRRWVFYYLTGSLVGISGLIMAWVNELTGYDSEKRAFIIASCNTFAYVFQAWLPIVIFPQVEQPRVFKGNVATAGISFGMICFALATLYLQKRDERRGVNRLAGTHGDSNGDNFGGSVAVTTSGSGKRVDDQGDAHRRRFGLRS